MNYKTASLHSIRRRRQTAGWLLGVSLIGLFFGIARQIYMTATYDVWQKRFIRGEPVVVKFLCDTDSVFECDVAIVVSYQKDRDDRWCETVRIPKQLPIEERWCNGSPVAHSFSITGALFQFDRFGIVTRGGALVGKLERPSN